MVEEELVENEAANQVEQDLEATADSDEEEVSTEAATTTATTTTTTAAPTTTVAEEEEIETELPPLGN